MKRTAFAIEVSVGLDFTRAEAGFLRDRAREHYDGTCRAAAEPSSYPGRMFDGLINAMVVVSSDTGQGWRTFTFQEIDLLVKVLEPTRGHPDHAAEGWRLTLELKRALGDIRDEYERLKAAGFPTP